MSKHWGPFDKRPNMVVILTDQQRTVQHFPPGWAEKHLPWLTYLERTGVTFERGMASATACSPSRSALFTSTYPTINGVLKVNETLSMSRTLPMGGSLTTLGQVLQQAGYQTAYKGKWHLDNSMSDFSTMRPSDHDRKLIEDDAFETRIAIEDQAMDRHYSMPAWTSPDLGTSESVSPFPVCEGSDSDLNAIGGGYVDNDARIVHGPTYSARQKSAVEFLRHHDPSSEPPFCLVVSMANPHDVWVYPLSFEQAGYNDPVWNGPDYRDFKLPASYDSSLDNKPKAQRQWKELFQPGAIKTRRQAREYVRFYAYLQTLVDRLTGEVIEALRDNRHVGSQLERDTLVVRLSDHGEMAMAQGGLRQKENNCYDESIQVPMTFSNPLLPQQGVRRESLVGLIDVLPTLAEIAGARVPPSSVIQGRSLAPELLSESAPSRKQYLFVTDDCSGSTTSIRTIVEKDWKYAVYYKASYSSVLNYNGELATHQHGKDKGQYELLEFELYRTGRDGEGGETCNLLPVDGEVSADDPIVERWQTLHTALTRLLADSYTLPDGWPKTVPVASEDDGDEGDSPSSQDS